MINKHSNNISEQLNKLIPGGAHTYSKGDDQFPANAPDCITHGKGAVVWGSDGREFVDCSMGLTSVSIGHGYKDVADAVSEVAYRGTNFQRPSLLELEAAREFLSVTDSGEMVKFAKNGSSVTTAAVKLARAFTGKSMVAVAKEHNFFSYDDWFIGTTPTSFGVPNQISKMTTTFNYNSIESIERLLVNEHDIACLIMEPVKFIQPTNNFLSECLDLCRQKGVVLILDEMVSGFKWGLTGAQGYFGVKADITTWGKGIANGFSACALSGRSDILELGGLRNAGSEKMFLLSSTHGAESTGLAALMATIKAFKKNKMIDANWINGGNLKNKINEVISKNGLSDYLKVIGYPCLFTLLCKNQDLNLDDGFKTLFMQSMIENGVLFQGLFYQTWSHGPEEHRKILDAFNNACLIYKEAIQNGGINGLLVGPVIKPVFRKYI